MGHTGNWLISIRFPGYCDITVVTPIQISDIPKEPAKRRAWVQMQLRWRGESFSSLARQHGVSREAVSQALLIPSYSLECAIAKALGLDARDLFPERYDASGRRLHRVLAQKVNTAKSRRNVNRAYSARVA